VRVEPSFTGNRAPPLEKLLRDAVGGKLKETLDALSAKARTEISLTELASAWRAGKTELARRFSIPPAQADRMAQSAPEVPMLIEELDLPPTTTLSLNTAAAGNPAQWQTLEQLSTGQKATAVLLLLLLDSDAPLIIDQPEDDLDNRFITESIVPKMRQEKRRRQFLFSTHNANIPVLGDAELIAGLSTVSDGGFAHGQILPEHLGSIDSSAVRRLAEEILEGGEAAFEMRRAKYGF
jgi:hypothetical protein